MNYMEKYLELVQGYRAKLDETNAIYDPKFAEVELMKGAAAYGWKKQELDKDYVAALAGVRSHFAQAFADLCQNMEKAITGAVAVAPTADQLAILAALRERDRISRDEFVQVKNAMAGCRIAEEALVELAHKHGYALGIDRCMPVDQAQGVLNTLRRSAERLTLKLSRTDATGQYTRTGDWSMFQISRSPEDAADCCRLFGSCDDPERFIALLEVPE